MQFKFNSKLVITSLLATAEAVAFLSIHTIQQHEQFDYVVTTPLTSTPLVTQTLPIQYSNLTALILYIGPVASQTTSPMLVELKVDQHTVASTRVQASAFSTNPFMPLDFATQPNSAEKNYTLTVRFLDGVSTTMLAPDQTPLTFFTLPQYEVRMWSKLPVLTERINLNHGGIVPPGVVYVLLALALWMSNLFLVTALQHVQTKIFSFKR